MPSWSARLRWSPSRRRWGRLGRHRSDEALDVRLGRRKKKAARKKAARKAKTAKRVRRSARLLEEVSQVLRTRFAAEDMEVDANGFSEVVE